MKLHLVLPYQSAAMGRMVAPLMELGKLHELTVSDKPEPADLNLHLPYHTLKADAEGRNAAIYTHCNAGMEEACLASCERADLVICMSFEGRRELVRMGVDPKKLWVIYSASGFKFRKRLIGIVGYPQPNGRKRESILLDLAWKYDLTPFEFLFIGSGWEDTCQKLASLGVTCRTASIPPDDYDAMARVYGVMDLFLVTGYTEGGPLPLLEAMSSGVKVLSPRFGYAADLLSQNEIYDGVEDLYSKIAEIFDASTYNHQLARAWSWSDYAAEHALAIGRMFGQSVDLYPERGMSRYAQLLDIIAETKPKAIMEIGTWNGGRAIQMIQEAAKYRQIESVQYKGFDLFDRSTAGDVRRELSKGGWPEDIVRRRIEATGAKVTLYAGDTNQMLNWNNAAFDFCFVDGGHSEETVRHDGEIVTAALKENGVIVFDDYYHEGRPDGVGCNEFIDSLDRDRFEVTHLPARTLAEDGRLIGMVKVRKNAPVLLQVREKALTGSDAWDDRESDCDVPEVWFTNETRFIAHASGKLERIAAAPGA